MRQLAHHSKARKFANSIAGVDGYGYCHVWAAPGSLLATGANFYCLDSGWFRFPPLSGR
jgi:hypothetical protein